MFTPLKTLLVAGGLALGLAASALTPAQASPSVSGGSLTIGAGNLSVTFGNGPQLVRHRDVWRDYRRARFCTPRRALRKAERRGLHRAHIRRVNGRRIVVAGRMRGERVVIGMGRHRSCPVDFVRVEDGRRGHIGRTGRVEAPIVRERSRDRVRAERPRDRMRAERPRRVERNERVGRALTAEELAILRKIRRRENR